MKWRLIKDQPSSNFRSHDTQNAGNSTSCPAFLFLHGLVKDVRTLFEKNNENAYIPDLSSVVSGLVDQSAK
jgi:hypothetical protein